jgi:alkylation response protein AidB-like acyl-CoA dehydrogenase
MDRTANGWVLNGAKVWSTGAHLCHYMIVLCRTSPPGEKDRHKGLSQVLVDLHRKGVKVRPIHVLSGAHHFNEVVFEDVEIANDEILGTEGQGWKQVTEELAYERSGPERYLSTFPLIVELARRLERERTPQQAMLFGRLLAQFWTLRNMSLRVNGLLAQGRMPNVEASVVKDLGTRFERDSVDVVRAILPASPALDSPDPFLARFAEAVLYSPSFTLRGGTNEILRGIIARGLGLR